MVAETEQLHNTAHNSLPLEYTKDDKLQGAEEQELWTTECLVDQLFLCLAGTKEYITTNRNDGTLPVQKYYSQARRLMRWIPIARLPSNEFIINISDLTPKIKTEIESTIKNPETLRYVLTQAAGRIFENLDFDYYHQSVARNLRVRLEA